MTGYDREFPHYGFASHVGYGTAVHLEAAPQPWPVPAPQENLSRSFVV